jgi:hypothetical protein
MLASISAPEIRLRERFRIKIAETRQTFHTV